MATLPRLFVSSFVLALLILQATPASASIVLDTHGFEAPDFDTTFLGTGQLEGQPVNPPTETWQKSLDGGASTATVQSTVVKSGSQAVQLDRAPNSNIRWGVPLSGYPLNPTDQILIAWDMRVEGPAGDPQSDFGPFFGVEAYALPGGGFSVLGSLGVDATTGEILYQDTGSGDLIAPGPTVAFGDWNSFSILLDYALHQYSIFLNNAPVTTGIGFVDGAFGTFSDADISGITAAAGSEGVAGTAYFDDFVITNEAVPEPPAVAVWLLGAVLATGAWWAKSASTKRLVG